MLMSNFFSAVHDRQLRRRLAHRDDVAEDLPNNYGASNLCGASDTGTLSVCLDDEIS